MGKKHENILQVLMTKIFQRIERLPTVSLVDEDRMNADKNVYPSDISNRIGREPVSISLYYLYETMFVVDTSIHYCRLRTRII